jgi:hypothetical protein
MSMVTIHNADWMIELETRPDCCLQQAHFSLKVKGFKKIFQSGIAMLLSNKADLIHERIYKLYFIKIKNLWGYA